MSIDHSDPFAALGQIVLGNDPLPVILDQVVRIASTVLSSDPEASLTLITGDTPVTIAFSGPPALALDERQYEAERGPCLDAARAGERILIPDLSADDRWPRYAEAAVEHGIFSSLSIPLPMQRELTGALNFYGRDRQAFDEQSIKLGETFAAHAAVAIANAHLYETTATLAEQMRQAMASRAVIEQAKGVIMRERRCTANDAFDSLVRLSQQSHRKLRDIAQQIVDEVAAQEPDQ